MTKDEFETGQYLDFGGERIYALTFRSATPAAWVVLCGPFPSDRLYSLGAWAKWARYLAGRDIAVVRFDYSGTGESTGRFEDQDFGKWLQDVERMAAWAAGQAGGRPVILHGLGMGGLLAQKAFSAGRGDGLLMWSPPLQGLDVLKQGLMLRLSMDMLLYRMPDRKSVKDYIQELKSGGTVQIDGYVWSGPLWTTAEQMALDKAYACHGEGVEEGSGRPWRHVVLDDSLSPLVKSQSMLRAMNPRAAIVPSAPLNRDFTGFFEPNAAWVRGSAENRMIAGRHA